MKKIININFQGRVIPIEESAYDILKQYVDSLRQYFANEDGRDEIINDIESRVAELFSDRLKHGANCIADEDVNAIIASIGRPADFEAADADATQQNYTGAKQQGSYQQTQTTTGAPYTRGKFVRNADDKILGGVCSGVANYLGIDPVIVRILFVLLGGALFWVYLLLWIIVPSQSVSANVTKRLYRNPEGKVIAGVCGGLAAYFNIETWIPRLIFALPFILVIITGGSHAFWDGDWGFGPKIFTGSLGSTLFVTYIILWIAVPFASTASEKLEMRGEKVDLNSIRDTVKDDLENFKSKAQQFGKEVKETAQNLSATAATQARSFSREAAPIARRTGSGLGHVIGILFKAFFLFIAGIIALSLFGVLIGLLFGGMATFPLKNFILDGVGQNVLAWLTLILFLGIPLIAIITWLIRRIMGVQSKNHYLGYVFSSLWFIGLVSAISLAGVIGRNFKSRSGIEESFSLVQPSNGKLKINVKNEYVHYYDSDWFGADWHDDLPIYGINQDTLMMNTVRVNVVKSNDSAYHIYTVRFSRGNTPERAKHTAENLKFSITQQDSLIILPKGFAISGNDKFRNQQVLVVIEVPIGKKVELDRKVQEYDWFNVNYGNRRGWNVQWDEKWSDNFNWDNNVEYIMTPDGLKKINDLDAKELKNGHFKMKIEKDGVIIEGEGEIHDKDSNTENNNDKYRYEQKKNSKKDTTIQIRVSEMDESTEEADASTSVFTRAMITSTSL